MKKIIFSLLILVFASTLKSQIASFENAETIEIKNIKAIQLKNDVQGYVVFYKLDKVSKKESLYSISILDNNLKQTNSIELIKGKDVILKEFSFNGEVLYFEFVSPNEKKLEIEVYNTSLVKTGGSSKELTKDEASFYKSSAETQAASQNPFSTFKPITPVSGKGFLKCELAKNAKGKTELTTSFIDNTANILWTNVPEENESPVPALITDDFWVTSIFVKKGGSKFRPEMDPEKSFTIYKDINTNKEIFRYKTAGEPSELMKDFSAGNAGTGSVCEYDKFNKEFYTAMDYYNEKTGLIEGIYYSCSSYEGKRKTEKLITWEKDLNKILPLNEKMKSEDGFSLYFHKFIKMADGKVYAIAEQYKKNGAAASMAGAMLLGGAVSQNVTLGNIIVIEFDKDINPIKASVFEKEKTKVALNGGFSFNGTRGTGYILKYFNLFDYSFITTSSDMKTFNCTYLNYDKDKENGDFYAVGNIALTKENQLAHDKIKLESKPTAFFVLPAKQGYSAIFEYFKKEKKLKVRLEKLNL